jgi:aminoglycoside 6-adenylyltransferase
MGISLNRHQIDLRKEKLETIIAWSESNKDIRLFKKHLTSEIWEKVERTFSGKNQNENWDALFAMADLVSEIGTDLSEKLGYEYPVKLERDIRQYLNTIQNINN